MIIIGSSLITITVAVGFLCVDETTWMQYRAIFPAGAGLTIGLGAALIVIGFGRRKNPPPGSGRTAGM